MRRGCNIPEFLPGRSTRCKRYGEAIAAAALAAAMHVSPLALAVQFGAPAVVANVTAGPAAANPPLLCSAMVTLCVFRDTYRTPRCAVEAGATPGTRMENAAVPDAPGVAVGEPPSAGTELLAPEQPFARAKVRSATIEPVGGKRFSITNHPLQRTTQECHVS